MAALTIVSQPPETSATFCLPAPKNGIMRAQASTDFFDLVRAIGLAQLVELLATALALGDPLFGELAGLDLLQDLLHLGLGLGGHDARAARDVAVLGGIADAVAHAGDAFLVHQVDDQLHLVQALEVRHLRLVPSLDQRLEAGAHQRGQTTAQHDLLAEQIGLGLFAEGGLDDASAGATDCLGVRQRERVRAAGRVLVHSDQARHTPALGVGTAHQVAWDPSVRS